MKRSAQVALLVMGVSGVGAGAYALTPPRNNCVPQSGASPSAVAPNPAGAPGVAAQPCPPRRSGSGSSGGGYYSSWSRGSSTASHWSTPIFSRGGSATSTVPFAGRSGSVGTSSGGGTARGGFGSTGHSASPSS